MPRGKAKVNANAKIDSMFEDVLVVLEQLNDYFNEDKPFTFTDDKVADLLADMKTFRNFLKLQSEEMGETYKHFQEIAKLNWQI